MRAEITVGGTPVSLVTSIVACIVFGFLVPMLWREARRGQTMNVALFLGAPLMTLIAIAHLLRLFTRTKITVAGTPLPLWVSIIFAVVCGLTVMLLWLENRTNRLASTGQQNALGQPLFDRLMLPWVDKTIAVVAATPFAFILYAIIKRGDLTIPLAVIVINHLVIIATMVFRTTPVRITPNPWYWLLAFTATYGGLFVPALAGRGGVALVPNVITDSLSILSLAVLLYARFSLGRNIGFVPAQRALVTRGAYGLVRHPIYTGIFISFLAWTLRVYSPLSVAISVVWCGLFVWKSFIEESFLREDPVYADYLTRVRWRWFPGLA